MSDRFGEFFRDYGDWLSRGLPFEELPHYGDEPYVFAIAWIPVMETPRGSQVLAYHDLQRRDRRPASKPVQLPVARLLNRRKGK